MERDLNNTLRIPPPNPPHATRSSDKSSSSRRSSTCSMSLTITVGGGGSGGQTLSRLNESTTSKTVGGGGGVLPTPEMSSKSVKVCLFSSCSLSHPLLASPVPRCTASFNLGTCTKCALFPKTSQAKHAAHSD